MDTLTLTSAYVDQHPVFIARAGDEIVGFYALGFPAGEGAALLRPDEKQGDAQLDHLWVLPSMVGQGIGRALFGHAETLARQQGATRLWVESDPHAEPFYRHMGMTVFGQRPAAMDDQPRTLPLLEKAL